MARLYFLIAAAAFVGVACANPEPIGFEIINNISKFAANITRAPLETISIESANFHYVIGARRNGDKQLGNDNEYKSGKGYSPENYQLRLNFPPPDTDTSSITYGEITVEQNSSISNIYVTSGGIGQSYISILIEAKKTTYLNTKAAFYGH